MDIPSQIMHAALARTNPYFTESSYVLYENLKKIGISTKERKERNIVFHSLRHFCATILAQETDIKIVKSVLGHRTEIMSEHYSNHE